MAEHKSFKAQTVGELKDILKNIPDDVIICERTNGHYSVLEEQSVSIQLILDFIPYQKEWKHEQDVEDQFAGKNLLFISLCPLRVNKSQK